MDSRRWDGFEFRDDDIVISTPSKCGTTWMQMQCALLVFQTPELPRPLTRLSPWLDVQTETVESVFAELAAQEHRRFIKTHTPLDGIPQHPGVTYLTVGRDPRDVALSWDNHMANVKFDVVLGLRAEAVGLDDLAELMPDGMQMPSEDPMVRFWEWMDAESDENVSSLPGMLHHLDTFWQRRNDETIAMFHYADMKADLRGSMRRLADVLKVDVDEATLDRLVHAAGFAAMRGRAEQLAPQVTHGFWQDSNRFFNKGESEQWRAFFTDADEARYEARARALVSPDLFEWVHHGSGGER